MLLLQTEKPTKTNSLNCVNRKIIAGISCTVLLLGLSGCQSTKSLFNKVDDGSLKYQEAHQLQPLQLPAEQKTTAFVPLYPTPKVGVNTLALKNESGKRYELPPPYRRSVSSNTNNN